jgi:cytoskeletal protein RodZ
MAKKRRTRAQKAKTASKRIEHLNKQQLAQPAKNTVSKTRSKSTQKAIVSSETKPQTTNKNLNLMRSLVLMVFLVLMQVALWIIFSMSTIDNNIYQRIQL